MENSYGKMVDDRTADRGVVALADKINKMPKDVLKGRHKKGLLNAIYKLKGVGARIRMPGSGSGKSSSYTTGGPGQDALDAAVSAEISNLREGQSMTDFMSNVLHYASKWNLKITGGRFNKEWDEEKVAGIKKMVYKSMVKLRQTKDGQAALSTYMTSIQHPDDDMVHGAAGNPLDNDDWATFKHLLSATIDNHIWEMTGGETGKPALTTAGVGVAKAFGWAYQAAKKTGLGVVPAKPSTKGN
ncbi:MAG: hypothetical protein DRP56_09005 [Planctomycetota bacterium]|nr:MAG: hypothetical protein DRP56_09005 [Planctomycetota bacterium]